MGVKFYQQGDVTLLRVDKLQTGLTRKNVDKRGVVLAEGEMTGHHHRVSVADQDKVELYTDSRGTMFLKVKEEVELVHEEHKSFVVEPGIYSVGQVNEYDHFAEEVRQVRD